MAHITLKAVKKSVTSFRSRCAGCLESHHKADPPTWWFTMRGRSRH